MAKNCTETISLDESGSGHGGEEQVQAKSRPGRRHNTRTEDDRWDWLDKEGRDTLEEREPMALISES